MVIIRIISDNIDNHLWENEAFIGGLGNPSSFGIVSIILSLLHFMNESICGQ